MGETTILVTARNLAAVSVPVGTQILVELCMENAARAWDALK